MWSGRDQPGYLHSEVPMKLNPQGFNDPRNFLFQIFILVASHISRKMSHDQFL